jgi:hypothetical protein
MFIKKTARAKAGEVSFDRTFSILFQNGFFGKDRRAFGPGRWLDIPGYGAYRSTSRWLRDEQGVEKPHRTL